MTNPTDPTNTGGTGDTGDTGETETDDEKTPEERAAKKQAQMDKRDAHKAGPHGKSEEAPGRVKHSGGSTGGTQGTDTEK